MPYPEKIVEAFKVAFPERQDVDQLVELGRLAEVIACYDRASQLQAIAEMFDAGEAREARELLGRQIKIVEIREMLEVAAAYAAAEDEEAATIRALNPGPVIDALRREYP